MRARKRRTRIQTLTNSDYQFNPFSPAMEKKLRNADKKIKQDIDKLRKVTNVYIIRDPENLLGGTEAKNSPVDCGKEVWEELYFNYKRKVV